MLLGAHVSFTGKDFCEVAKNLNDLKCFQVFLGNKYSTKPIKFIDKKNTDLAKKYLKNIGVFVHVQYTSTLINKYYFKGYAHSQLITILEFCGRFSSQNKDSFNSRGGAIIHPGTTNIILNKKVVEELSLFDALDKIVDNITKIYYDPYSGDYPIGEHQTLGKLILENCAGKGETVPRNVLEMAYIIKRLQNRQDKNGITLDNYVRFCIDTCHLFAVGDYDLRKSEEILRFKYDFQKHIGLEYLECFHLNDSLDPLGSHADNHADLGHGMIWGEDNSSLLTLIEEFKDYPMIVEPGSNGNFERSQETINKLLHGKIKSSKLYVDDKLKKSPEKENKYKLFFDGGSRDDGRCGCGGVIYSGTDIEMRYSHTGERTFTHNVMEYFGLIYGLMNCKARGIKRIKIYGDSQLVVNQVNGKWKINVKNLQKLHSEVLRLLEHFDEWSLEWIPRGDNKEADEMADLGIEGGQHYLRSV